MENEICGRCKKDIKDWCVAKENLWGDLELYHSECYQRINLSLNNGISNNQQGVEVETW